MNGYQLVSASNKNISQIEVVVDNTTSELTGLVSQNVTGSGFDVVFSGIHLIGAVDLNLANGSLKTVFGFIDIELKGVNG
jgi:hypothetical protein